MTETPQTPPAEPAVTSAAEPKDPHTRAMEIQQDRINKAAQTLLDQTGRYAQAKHLHQRAVAQSQVQQDIPEAMFALARQHRELETAAREAMHTFVQETITGYEMIDQENAAPKVARPFM